MGFRCPRRRWDKPEGECRRSGPADLLVLPPGRTGQVERSETSEPCGWSLEDPVVEVSSRFACGKLVRSGTRTLQAHPPARTHRMSHTPKGRKHAKRKSSPHHRQDGGGGGRDTAADGLIDHRLRPEDITAKSRVKKIVRSLRRLIAKVCRSFSFHLQSIKMPSCCRLYEFENLF